MSRCPCTGCSAQPWGAPCTAQRHRPPIPTSPHAHIPLLKASLGHLQKAPTPCQLPRCLLPEPPVLGFARCAGAAAPGATVRSRSHRAAALGPQVAHVAAFGRAAGREYLIRQRCNIYRRG